jgi:hypothetical protein
VRTLGARQHDVIWSLRRKNLRYFSVTYTRFVALENSYRLPTSIQLLLQQSHLDLIAATHFMSVTQETSWESKYPSHDLSQIPSLDVTLHRFSLIFTGCRWRQYKVALLAYIFTNSRFNPSHLSYCIYDSLNSFNWLMERHQPCNSTHPLRVLSQLNTDLLPCHDDHMSKCWHTLALGFNLPKIGLPGSRGKLQCSC